MKTYTEALLQVSPLDEKITEKIPTAKLLLKAYQLGLERKLLPVGLLVAEIDLEQDIPAPYHTAVAQMAIILSGFSTPAKEYIVQNLEKFLKDFRDYFWPHH